MDYDEIVNLVPMKPCTKCKKYKILSEYHKNPKGKFGRDSRCIKCKNLQDKLSSRKTKHKKACNDCELHRTLQANGLCEECNSKLGLKECSNCHEVKLKYSDFTFGGSKCHTCYPTDDSVATALEDWLKSIQG